MQQTIKDNNNKETLQDAAFAHACEFRPEESTIRLSSFQHGAKWQEDVEKAKELLQQIEKQNEL